MSKQIAATSTLSDSSGATGSRRNAPLDPALSSRLQPFLIGLALILAGTIFNETLLSPPPVTRSESVLLTTARSEGQGEVGSATSGILGSPIDTVVGNGPAPAERRAGSPSVQRYIHDHISADSSDSAIIDVAVTLLANSYYTEARDLLLTKIRAALNEGKALSIEMLQLLRTTMAQQGALTDYGTFLATVPQEHPLKPQLISEYSAYLYQDGNAFEAESMLVEAVLTYPTTTSVWEGYASLLKSENRLLEAQTAYQEVLKFDDSAEMRIELGKLYWANGQFAEASQTFEQVIHIVPQYEEEISQLLIN